MKKDENLGNSIFKSVLWTVLMRFSVRFLGIISVLILARVLVPEDFGLVSKAVLISGFLELCSEFGFDNALIKKQDANRDDYCTAWTLSIIRGAILASILILFSQVFANFLHEPALQLVFCCYGLSIFINGFINIGEVNFRKEIKFHLDFQFNFYSKLSSFLTTLTIALIWQSYWAFPLGMLVREITSVSLSFVMSDYRPALSLKSWRSLFNFSKWMLSFNVLSAFSAKLDTFILSRFSGENELGLYTVAYEVAGTPSAEIAMPVARASLPGLAKLNQTPSKFRQMNADIIANVLLVALPAGIGLSALSLETTLVMLGEQWRSAAIFVEVLALFGISRVIRSTSISSLIAYGLVDVLAKLTVAILMIRLICLPLGFYLGGATGMVYGVLISGLFTMVMYLTVQRRFEILSIDLLVQRTWRTCIASVLMYCVLVMVITPHPSFASFPLILSLGIKVVLGALCFISVLLSLWYLSGKPNGAEQKVVDWLWSKISRRAPLP